MCLYIFYDTTVLYSLIMLTALQPVSAASGRGMEETRAHSLLFPLLAVRAVQSTGRAALVAEKRKACKATPSLPAAIVSGRGQWAWLIL